MKKKTPKQLKKELWELCRQLTRKRYGTDCFTCPARNLVGSNLHTGHFITKSTCSAAMAYSLDNLRPQCYRCNIHLSGAWVAYETHLIRDGIDVQELKQRNRQLTGKKYDVLFYQRLIDEYRLMLNSVV